MKPFSIAQQIYIHVFGVDFVRMLNHSAGKQFSNTKRGPGRKHKSGIESK